MKGQVEKEIFKFNERVEIRLKRELSKGRSRINCTAKDSQGNGGGLATNFIIKISKK